MAGKYNCVHARLNQVNNLATFVPCAAHSLNLLGVHAANSSVEIVTFFATSEIV